MFSCSQGKAILIFLIVLIILFNGCARPEEENSIVSSWEENLTVIRVIDGDTVLLSNGETVRLIGIDAPERGENCYKEAKEKLGELVEWKEAEVEEDVEERDKYGRKLYYIYVDGNFINLEVVRLGYAISFEYPPNIKYASIIRNAEAAATEDKAGCLWAAEK